jgi:hypothetical protein
MPPPLTSTSPSSLEMSQQFQLASVNEVTEHAPLRIQALVLQYKALIHVT